VISRPGTPELGQNDPPSKQRRAQRRPGADRTHGPRAEESTRQNHRYEPNIRPSLRDGFTNYTCSPQGPALLPLSSARCASIIANLTPAPGRQDHTTSPCASDRSSARNRAATRHAHRIPHSTSVTVAKRPSR